MNPAVYLCVAQIPTHGEVTRLVANKAKEAETLHAKFGTSLDDELMDFRGILWNDAEIVSYVREDIPAASNMGERALLEVRIRLLRFMDISQWRDKSIARQSKTLVSKYFNSSRNCQRLDAFSA